MTVVQLSAVRGDLRRAHLRRLDGNGELPVHFNPSQITIGKSATWTATPARGAATAPQPEFTGPAARTIQLTLTLDGPSSGRDVAADAELLQSWCNPTPESIQAGTPQPPLLQLEWTSPAVFDVYLSAATVTYVLFDRDGAPLRATADVRLTESPTSAQRQNPTSGGQPGHATRVLQAGESLQSLAYEIYGDPTLWRALGRFNRVDNPLRLRAGRRIDLPPAAAMRELAR